jgi:hypothetical protein
MRKGIKKQAKKAAKKQQAKETVVSTSVETEQAAETPVALVQEDTAVVTAPVTEEKVQEVNPDAEQSAPKRTRKTKIGKVAAELSPLKHKEKKEKSDIPENAEETTLIQYEDLELNVADLREKVISAYVEAGHRRGRISKLNLYIKPEDRKVYYVINDKTTGSVDF